MTTIETALIRAKKRQSKIDVGSLVASVASALAAIVAAAIRHDAWSPLIVTIAGIALYAAWHKAYEARNASDEHLDDAIRAATGLREYFYEAKKQIERRATELAAEDAMRVRVETGRPENEPNDEAMDDDEPVIGRRLSSHNKP